MILRYSSLIKQADDNYLDRLYKLYIDRGETEQLQQLVLEQAKKKGYNIGPVYHGTREEFTVFSEQDTSYGFFTSPDRDTAAFYGEIVLALFLRGKEIDLDDPQDFNKVGNEAIFGDEAGRNDEEAREWFQSLYEENKGKPFMLPIKQDFFPDEPESEDWSFGDELKDRGLNSKEIEEWVEELERANPWVRKSFEENVPNRNTELETAEQAYGSQDFYMQYQNDFLQAAENMGYTVVHLTDPAGSTGGESASTVFFSPEQAKLTDPVTKDDAGNIIPLSKRFESNNPDIRY